MSKLKRRCIFVGSAALHLVVLFMLIFVPQFTAANEEQSKSLLLWKLNSQNPPATIYFLGSYHSLRKEDHPFDPLYDFAFSKADRLVTEIVVSEKRRRDPMADSFDMWEKEIAKEVERKSAYVDAETKSIEPKLTSFHELLKLYKDDYSKEDLREVYRKLKKRKRTIKFNPRDLYNGDWYDYLVNYFGKLGYSKSFVDQEPPLKLAGIVERKIDQSQGLYYNYGADCHYESRTVSKGILTFGLENMLDRGRAYIEVHEDAPLMLQARYLRQVILEAAKNELDTSAAGIDAWKNGNLDFFEKYLKDIQVNKPKYYNAMIRDRNHNWVPRVETFIKYGGVTFIIAGVGHFAGPDSLIKLLEKRGHTITRLKPTRIEGHNLANCIHSNNHERWDELRSIWPNVNLPLSIGVKPLYYAAFLNRVEFIDSLLDDGAEIDLKSSSGFTALYTACHSNRIESAKLLLEHGANPNVRQFDGSTPLHIAAFQGNKNLVRLLLEHGSDSSIRNLEQKKPIHYAEEADHTDVVKILLEQKKSMFVRK